MTDTTNTTKVEEPQPSDEKVVDPTTFDKPINHKDHDNAMKRSSKAARKSSFFQRAHQSFVRGGGTRGASVENLRGTTGADFEGNGTISRGDSSQEVGCFCFGRTKPQQRFLLIKGPFCFVFVDETATSPKYAIALQYMNAQTKSSNGGRDGHVNVKLENNLGDVQYEFHFDTEDTALQFCRTVQKQAASAQAAQVRKDLGHEHLLNKRSSLIFAEKIALTKEADQPSEPITTTQIMTHMPTPAL